jgi:hypothetical protein
MVIRKDGSTCIEWNVKVLNDSRGEIAPLAMERYKLWDSLGIMMLHNNLTRYFVMKISRTSKYIYKKE